MAIVLILIICLGIVANLVNVFVFSLNNKKNAFVLFSLNKKKKSLKINLLSHLSLIDMLILVVFLLETLFDVYVVDEEIQIVLKVFCKFFDLLLIHFLLHMRNFIFMKIAIDGNFFTYIFNSLCFNFEFLAIRVKTLFTSLSLVFLISKILQ